MSYSRSLQDLLFFNDKKPRTLILLQKLSTTLTIAVSQFLEPPPLNDSMSHALSQRIMDLL